MTAWGTALPFELNNADGRCGSKASIRFLNQRPFDQLFTCLGPPIFERPLCRFLHCDCDDEQRLLWPSLWSFPTDNERTRCVSDWPKAGGCQDGKHPKRPPCPLPSSTSSA